MLLLLLFNHKSLRCGHHHSLSIHMVLLLTVLAWRVLNHNLLLVMLCGELLLLLLLMRMMHLVPSHVMRMKLAKVLVGVLRVARQLGQLVVVVEAAWRLATRAVARRAPAHATHSARAHAAAAYAWAAGVLLKLRATILEPYFHLSLRQAQIVRQLCAIGQIQILSLIEFVIESLELLARVYRTRFARLLALRQCDTRCGGIVAATIVDAAIIVTCGNGIIIVVV